MIKRKGVKESEKGQIFGTGNGFCHHAHGGGLCRLD